MSSIEIAFALKKLDAELPRAVLASNLTLRQQGLPELRTKWIELHYGSQMVPHREIASVNLTRLGDFISACVLR